ncbi:MAG: hypothetical protein ACKVP0_19360 [Pirellulaceae bacterium]
MADGFSMTEKMPILAKFHSARKKLLYVFVITLIGWLVLAAFLPPVIVFSIADAIMFYLIWNGSSFAKFQTVPWLLGRGAVCLLVTIGCIAAAMSGSHDSGSQFFAAMLPGVATFTLCSLGAGIALLLIPNVAEVAATDLNTQLLRARMALADLRVAERRAAAEQRDQNESIGPANICDGRQD